MSKARAGHDPHDVVLVTAAPSGERFEVSGPRRRRTMLAVIATFVLLVAACAIAGILAWQDIRATSAVMDARQSRQAGVVAFEQLLIAETAQRGYLLTRDLAYLANYDDAKAGFAKALSDLRDGVADESPRSGMIADFAGFGAEKFAELDKTVALGKDGRFDDAIAIVRAGAGKTLMDRVRRIVNGMTADATGTVSRTVATQSQLNAQLIGAIVIALVCVTGLAILLLSDARRYFGLLETREFGARQLAETLERRVARRTRELAEANQRFEAALRASGVTVMTQDRDLVFTWISQGIFGREVPDVVGSPEAEVTPGSAIGAVTSLKRGVIESGEPARADIRAAIDGIDLWYDLTVHPLKNDHGSTVGIIAGAVDITRYKEQEARIRLLMRELTHRSKNLLTVIQAIVRQTAANSTSIDDFQTRFSARLHSLAGSHDLLVREDWRGASMRELVRSQLGHYIDRAESQITLNGEPLRIGPNAAQHIGMAIHELATNAAKYGALSTPDGTVTIFWHISPAEDGKSMCHLSWTESGGPMVQLPSRRGFGRVVIERAVARAVHGEVRIDYGPSGLRWTLEFPERLTPDS